MCDRKCILQLDDVPWVLLFVRVLPLGQQVVEGRKFQVSQVGIAIQLFVIFLLEVLVSLRFLHVVFFSLESLDLVLGHLEQELRFTQLLPELVELALVLLGFWGSRVALELFGRFWVQVAPKFSLGWGFRGAF